MNTNTTGGWWSGVSCFFFLFFLISPVRSIQAETLTISTDVNVIHFEQKDIIKHPALVDMGQITLPAYPNQALSLKGVPLCKLLQGLPLNPENYLKVTAKDDYIAYFSINDFYPCASNKIPAFLIAEDPQYPWPLIINSDRSAGPFYLVLLGKRFSESVYGVQGMEIVAQQPLEATLSAAKMNAQELAGARVFIAKCNVCHALNGTGSSHMAHDLNNPNPLNYFSEDELRRFIRDPRSIRPVISPKKYAFTPGDLSLQALNELIAFLRFVQENTSPSTQANH